MTTAPASPEHGPAGQAPEVPGDPGGPGRPVSEVAGFPGDADRDGDVDVLYLAGQGPATLGEWLVTTAVDGVPGAEFTARVLPAEGRSAHGGDVVVHLAADAGHREPLTVRAGAWAVMCGHLVPVAEWDHQEPEGWPEKIRATVAFTIGVLTELEEHGADLAAGYRVDLDDAMVTAKAGIPADVTSALAGAASCRVADTGTPAPSRGRPAGARTDGPSRPSTPASGGSPEGGRAARSDRHIRQPPPVLRQLLVRRGSIAVLHP